MHSEDRDREPFRRPGMLIIPTMRTLCSITWLFWQGCDMPTASPVRWENVCRAARSFVQNVQYGRNILIGSYRAREPSLLWTGIFAQGCTAFSKAEEHQGESHAHMTEYIHVTRLIHIMSCGTRPMGAYFPFS